MKRKVLLAALLGGLLPFLVGCAGSTGGDAVVDGPDSEVQADDWVVVHYDHESWDASLDVLDVLLETELAADEALAAANLGWIDGNEVGEQSYDIYFVGYDHVEMWATLEPIFAAAPLRWTRVELRNSLEGEATVELSP